MSEPFSPRIREMKGSVRKVIESLQLTTDEATCLRDATRAWLEKTYNNDHEVIARLRREEVENEACKFLQKERTRFFLHIGSRCLPSRGRHYKDPLVAKITTIMMCQVEYKSRLLKRKSSRKATQITRESDAESITTKSTDGSNRGWTNGDHDYEPSHATSESPWVKLHYTRQNAQPGMPTMPSIEIDDELERGSLQSAPERNSHLRGENTTETESTIEDTIIANVSSITTVDSIRDVNNINRQFEQTPTKITTQSISAVGDTAVSHIGLLNPQSVSSLVLSDPVVGACSLPQGTPIATGHYRRLVTVPRMSTVPDLSEFDFDQFIHPLQEDSGAIDPTDGTLEENRNSERADRIRTPRCEQTPPSSGRFNPGTRTAPVEITSDSEIKPRRRRKTQEVLNVAKPNSGKIFVGGDHYKVVRYDQSFTILQRLVDALNDRSREYQRLAQRVGGTLLEQKAAEDKAVNMCELVTDLREDTQIWDHDSV